MDELLQLEELGELLHRVAELLLRDAIDLLKDAEAVGGRDVPHELRPVAHEQGHPFQVGVLAPPGYELQDPRLARAGMKEPGEHLERRGLPRAVRPEVPKDLALFDGEVEVEDAVS